jgi:tRNA(fMet)-specific endonuclease VapC
MPQNEYSVAEAKKHFSELLGRVAYAGERIVIAKRGKPVAVLVPPAQGLRDDRLATVEGWLEENDPFFDIIERIVAGRKGHAPRALRPVRKWNMHLLDTNVLSELVKKLPSPALVKRLEFVPPETLFTSSICVMELRFGALRIAPEGHLWAQIQERILSRVRVLTFSYKEAIIAGEILDRLYSAGRPIGIEDVMIGSVAISNGLVVVSANTKHFSRISGLKVENWLQ